jgi:hypothetical protein
VKRTHCSGKQPSAPSEWHFEPNRGDRETAACVCFLCVGHVLVPTACSTALKAASKFTEHESRNGRRPSALCQVFCQSTCDQAHRGNFEYHKWCIVSGFC